jgi:hypothetical protein
MRPLYAVVLLAVVLNVLPGCSKKAVQSASAPVVTGEQSKAGAFLAYEHKIRVDLKENTIAARVEAVREACVSERFGACSLLSVEQSSGNYPHGEIAVRIIPAGVEPLVKLASEGGSVGTRTTSAEDLAETVADTARERELLTRQRVRLEEFNARKDLSVTDMLALSKELAAIEVQGDALEKEMAQQRRRIETNRLTINFAVPYVESGGSRIGEAFKALWSSLVEGVVDALAYLGYGLPFLVLGFPLLLILRWAWRKATRIRA